MVKRHCTEMKIFFFKQIQEQIQKTELGVETLPGVDLGFENRGGAGGVIGVLA